MARKRRGRGHTALITGASRGIGEAIAECFAADGYDLILVARSGPTLDLLASDLATGHDVNVIAAPMDLRTPDAGSQLLSKVTGLGRHVDVLVNNAGMGLMGRFVELSHADQLAMIDLNIRTLTDISRTFIPLMIGYGGGGVMNIAATAAFLPGPHMAVYCATKAYVLSFSEALNHELKGTGVHVTAVCPGPVKTGFHEHSGAEGSNLLRLMPAMSPDRLAKKAFAAFHARRSISVPGLMNRLTVRSVALTPRGLLLPLISFMHRHRD